MILGGSQGFKTQGGSRLSLGGRLLPIARVVFDPLGWTLLSLARNLSTFLAERLIHVEALSESIHGQCQESACFQTAALSSCLIIAKTVSGNP